MGGGPHEAVGRRQIKFSVGKHTVNYVETFDKGPCLLLTGAFLAGVCKVIVAGYVTPASVIMPHHHYTVFTRQEIAVWLPAVPVLIQLYVRREGMQVNLFLLTICM